jgi:hypothetical protein
MILMRNSQSGSQMGMIFWHSRRFILPDENNAWLVVRSSYAEIDGARRQEPTLRWSFKLTRKPTRA